MLLAEQTSTGVGAMDAEAEGEEDPWAEEAMEVAAVAAVAGEDFPVEEAEAAASRELGTGSALILLART